MPQPPAKIHVLPKHLQNQIAAGEVVERPASVIKELMENSLDAGADRIDVTIDDGGRSLIRIQDNGSGITADDMPLAVTRHATSKIAHIDDLFTITSFGFRGEALPSIASVSRFRMVSLADGQEDATFYASEHGTDTETGPAAHPRGTTIEVRDLFGAMPARLKFLKSPATENRRCQDAFTRLALTRLDVAFSLNIGGRQALFFPKTDSLKARLTEIWPPSVVEGLVPVDFTDDDLGLHGVVGRPENAQARGDRILFYVNGRSVADKVLLRALRDAFKGRLLSREYPQATLFLTIDPKEVDVNVHPAKTEVRFRDESRLFRFMHHAISRALEQGTSGALAFSQPPQSPPVSHHQSLSGNTTPQRPTPRNPFAKFATFAEYEQLTRTNSGRETTPPYRDEKETQDFLSPSTPPQTYASSPVPPQSSDAVHETYTPQQTWQNIVEDDAPVQQAHDAASPQPVQEDGPAPSSQHALTGYTYLGQISDTYLVLRAPDNSLALIDQHAAHERILFESMKQRRQKGDSRPLAIPLEIPLHQTETQALERLWPTLTEIGFGLDLSRPGTVVLSSIPTTLEPAEARAVLKDMAAEKIEGLEEVWKMLSCRAALKAGSSLAKDEAQALLEALGQCANARYCPHGRPVMVGMSALDLEKMFKRKP
ncbi:DNA mismatch repair endonuclease MutL [Desulfovibrio inopinatus]|uniref:DNA mismatch repair endonuclease MutL n=1 Tax=Desulfovibrio inopinatus TaxID=102109 RepID=UPI000421282B|nr:DNA mismatch repair endonuclease MutL [Desulfovibrio inopinatus]